MLYICLYLSSIIAANLIISAFGTAAVIFVSFALIGLDLTTRDKLHEAWHNNHLALKMAALIAVGSVLSWFLDRDAGPVAVASFVAFGAAAVTDTLIYQILYKQPWRIKVNGSNVFSAAVDSIVFPTLAFGGLMPLVTLVQFSSKVAGGFIWSLIISSKRVNIARVFDPQRKSSDG